MFRAVTERSADMDVIIKAAAVADYTPETVSDSKMKKSDNDLSIPLKRTQDILKYLGANKKPGQFLCGFSMETDNMLENSRKKLFSKNCDMICANSLRQAGAGFGVDTNVITLITGEKMVELPQMSKEAAAHKILDAIIYG
jgi:phosphopantothenoylcysteine decarboxylase/phosphopantothenate--cysteine ligase